MTTFKICLKKKQKTVIGWHVIHCFREFVLVFLHIGCDISWVCNKWENGSKHWSFHFDVPSQYKL